MEQGVLVVWMRVRSGSVAAMVMATLVVGCGSQTGEPKAVGADNPAITPTSSPTASTSPRARSLTGRLLTAEDLKQADDGPMWAVESTRPTEGRDLSGACHRFALQSIGATKVVRRTFEDFSSSHMDTQATEVVATFADVKSAKRAYAVLLSWQETCAEQLPAAAVGEITQVPVGAAAAWYHVSQGDLVDGQGLVRRGSRLAVLTITRPDIDRPTGDTIVAVLKKASALL